MNSSRFSRTLTATLLTLALLTDGCSSKREKVIGFFSTFGLSGTNEVIHAQSFPAINDDYKNLDYFYVVKMTKLDFDSFINTNGFTTETVLALPTASSNSPRVPGWWNAPGFQADHFSKKLGNLHALASWTNGVAYFYGED
jgi:hypothetical protein